MNGSDDWVWQVLADTPLMALYEEADTRVRRGEPISGKLLQAYKTVSPALRKAIHLDPLTRTLNRQGFTGFLEEALQRARSSEYKNDTLVTFLDLDNFKAFNDREGHVRGDLLLKTTADYFKSNVKLGTPIARTGGDEFGIIFSRITESDQPFVERLEKIANDYPGAIAELGADSAVTMSIGATWLDPAVSSTTVLRRADDAMYHAKLLRKRDNITRVCLWIPETNYQEIRREAAEQYSR